MYVTGEFNSIGGVAARNVARWDGSSWSALAEGVVHPGAYMTTRRYQGVDELDIVTTSSTTSAETSPAGMGTGP